MRRGEIVSDMIYNQKFCTYKVSIFQHFDCDEADELLKLVEHRNYKKGELLFLEGEKAETLFIVNEGKLKLYKYTKTGREQILYLLKEGDCWGELQLLYETNFDCSAKVLEDCYVSTIKKADFQRLMLKNPEMSLKLLGVVGKRLDHLEQMAMMLADNDSDAKLAYLLLKLADEYGIRLEDRVSVSLPMTREEMANYTGLTKETISRKLKLFSNQGLIEVIGHKKIDVLDYDYLMSLI